MAPKKSGANKPTRKAPKKSVAKKKVKRAAPVVAVQKSKRADKYKSSRVEHFIDTAAVTKSTVRAVMATEGSVTLQEASELMKQPDVQTAIAAKRMSLAAECGITSQKIMKEYASMGFSNMRDYAGLLTADSVTLAMEEMTPEQTASIQELTTETYWDESAEKEVKRVKIKLYPKEVALQKMAAHIGIKGFGGQLQKASDTRLGVETVVAPDGTVTTKAIVQHLSDEELYRIAAGEDNDEGYEERSE